MYPQPVCGPSVLSPGAPLRIEDDYGPGSCSGAWEVDQSRISRGYQNRVKVELSNRYAGPAQVIGLVGVKLGDTYRHPLFASSATEVDTGSFAQSIRAERSSDHSADGQVQWIVTIDYGPFDTVFWMGSGYLSTGQVDPTARVLEVYWDAAKYEISRPEDFSDPPKPYVNTVGDPLIDPPKFEETRPVLKIVRRESTYDGAYASSFQDTVNEDTFLGFPPYTVKCREIRGERDYDPDWGLFWIVTYEFEFRVTDDGNGFKQFLVNQGYRYKKDGTGDPINAVDGNGEQVTDAVLLSEGGDKLADGDDPYLLEFTEFPPVAFADLDIPQDILYQTI